MRWLLPTLVLLSACKPTPYQLGVKAAADGDYIQATEHFIRALDKDVTQQRPRDALLDVGPKAFEEHVELAQEHEASKRYPQALEAYEDALDLGNELEELDLLAFSLQEVKLEMSAVRGRWAVHEWSSAIAADEDARWADAIAHFETFRTLKPDHPELDERQGLTYLLWAEDDVANKRFSDGAEHYRQAHALTGRESLKDWAAAIEVALGRYGLDKGHCRYAVERFEAAGTVKNEPTLEAERKRAWECARRGIALQPLEAQVDVDVAGIDVGAMLIDRIEHEIERQGSRYLVLLAARGDNQSADRVDVSARLTQATVQPPAQGTVSRTVTGYEPVPCDKQVLLYEPDAVCSEEVQVSYDVTRAAAVVRIAGTVKIVTPDDGQQKTRPLEVTLQHDVTHASGFQIPGEDGPREVMVAAVVDPTHVEVPGDVVALDRPPEPLPPPAEILRDAVALMAEEAGRVIVEAADHEEPPAEPAFLKIKDPIALPEDLDFARPTLVEPEPEPEIEALMEPVEPPAPPTDTAPDGAPADGPDATPTKETP